MLLNAANMDLPTDEGDHNELDKALNGIETVQNSLKNSGIQNR
jgi:hypothetical protein